MGIQPAVRCQPHRHNLTCCMSTLAVFDVCACGLTLFEILQVVRYFCVVAGVGFKPRTTLRSQTVEERRAPSWQSVGQHPWIITSATSRRVNELGWELPWQRVPHIVRQTHHRTETFSHDLLRWNRISGQIAQSRGTLMTQFL